MSPFKRLCMDHFWLILKVLDKPIYVYFEGNIDKVDLSKLNQIDESLKRAKGKMVDSDLDRKLAELNDVARTQEDMINDYDRQIREIRADILNLEDIKKTLPDGCFNTPSIEKP